MAFVSPFVTAVRGCGSAQLISRRRSRRAFRNAPRMTASAPKVSPVPVESEDNGPTEVLELTLENVEKVLDELRPYLMSDGMFCAPSHVLRLTVSATILVCVRS
jgi:hypothetical protein